MKYGRICFYTHEPRARCTVRQTHTKENVLKRNQLEAHTIALMGIMLVYVLLAAAYAIRTPAWQSPDEPAHYNVIAQICANGCCPVIEMGDWDQAYLDTLKSAEFAPELLDRIGTIQYEDHQPPLYYLAASVVYRLTEGSLTALRLFSAFLGGVTVWLAYRVGRSAFPSRPLIALGAAGFVAFIPQHLSILASVNNDSAAGVVIGVGLLAVIGYLKGDRVPVWVMGAIAGIGWLTKANTVSLGAIMAAAILFRWWTTQNERRVSALVRDALLFGVPLIALAALWWIRNIGVYGFPDILGLGAHDRVVIGQMRTAEILAQVGWGEYLRRAAETTFNSFWGQFGWMGLPLTAGMYWAILIGIGVVTLSGVIGLIRRFPADSADRRWLWGVVWLLIALAAAQYVYYNTSFYQVQGRYLFPALIPLGLLVGWSLDVWGRERGGALAWIALTPLVGLALLSAYLVWRVIPILNIGI